MKRYDRGPIYRLWAVFYPDGQFCFRSGTALDHRSSAAKAPNRRGVGRGNFLWLVRRLCRQRSKKKKAAALMQRMPTALSYCRACCVRQGFPEVFMLG
jgi:hypothetical protein